jgi:hypothetical protein
MSISALSQGFISGALAPLSQTLLDNTLCAGYNRYRISQIPPGPESVLKVFQQIEEGTTRRFLEYDWEQPSATQVGRLFDWLCSAGEYSKSKKASELSQLAKRTFSDHDYNKDLEADCKTLSSDEVLCIPTATGNEVNFYVENNTRHCPYVDPEYYNVHISLISKDFNSILPKVQACLQEFLSRCQSNCLGCWHIPDYYKNVTIGSNFSAYNFTSKYYSERTWKVDIEAQEFISKWFKERIDSFTHAEIEYCEEKARLKESETITWVIMATIPLVIGGIITGAVCVMRKYDATHADKTRKITYNCFPSEDQSDAPMIKVQEDEKKSLEQAVEESQKTRPAPDVSILLDSEDSGVKKTQKTPSATDGSILMEEENPTESEEEEII